MKDLYTAPRYTRRSIALIVAGIVAGAAVLTPAVSGAAAFLTKKKADKRYLGNTTVATASGTTGPSGGAATTLTVACPAGQQATNGGMDSPVLFGGSAVVLTLESRPNPASGKPTGWYVEVAASAPLPFTVYAVCVP
jgi:hypothetical protein